MIPPPLRTGTPTRLHHFPLRLPACETDTRQTCELLRLPYPVVHGAAYHRSPPGQRLVKRKARWVTKADTSSSESGRNRDEGTRLFLFVRESALFFSTVHGAFLFGKAKRKGG